MPARSARSACSATPPALHGLRPWAMGPWGQEPQSRGWPSKQAMEAWVHGGHGGRGPWRAGGAGKGGASGAGGAGGRALGPFVI